MRSPHTKCGATRRVSAPSNGGCVPASNRCIEVTTIRDVSYLDEVQVWFTLQEGLGSLVSGTQDAHLGPSGSAHQNRISASSLICGGGNVRVSPRETLVGLRCEPRKIHKRDECSKDLRLSMECHLLESACERGTQA